jgi:hypothetical protein
MRNPLLRGIGIAVAILVLTALAGFVAGHVVHQPQHTTANISPEMGSRGEG